MVSEGSATGDCSAVGNGAGEGRGEDVSGNDVDKYADGTAAEGDEDDDDSEDGN